MTSHDDALRRALARHRAFATLLLVAMAALMVLAYQFPAGFWPDLLAAFIGQSADEAVRLQSQRLRQRRLLRGRIPCSIPNR
jgi:hypothetical protein